MPIPLPLLCSLEIAPLQHRPEGLYPVRVGLFLDIFPNGMLDNLVGVQADIATVFVARSFMPTTANT